MKRTWYTEGRLLLSLLLISVLMLPACGYSLHRQSDLPFTEIEIGRIENRTFEPKLQDKLHAALSEEFMKNGVMVNPGAGIRISAVIHAFEMTILSEKQDLVTEYRVNINTDFTVEDVNKKRTEYKNISSPFIVSLTTPDDLGRLLGMKELAEKKALKDAAMRIVGGLIYR
jgi:outer membrane lipopolysaccharide assembly protein LptE/RlpB